MTGVVTTLLENLDQKPFSWTRDGEAGGDDDDPTTTNTPIGWISSPQSGSTTFDSTIFLHTSNFLAGPNAGRITLTLDDSYTTHLIAEEAVVKLSGLTTGRHNLTMSVYLRPGSPEPYTIERCWFNYVNLKEESGKHLGEYIESLYHPVKTSDLFELRAQQKKKAVPILEIISPTHNHKILEPEYSVVFLFDFICDDEDGSVSGFCGRRSLENNFNADVYLDGKIVSSNYTVLVGEYTEIPMPSQTEFGEHTISILITQQTGFAGVVGRDIPKPLRLPIAGNTTYFSKYEQ